MFTGSVGGKWETDDCFKSQAFMCEIPAGVDVKPDQPVARKFYLLDEILILRQNKTKLF